MWVRFPPPALEVRFSVYGLGPSAGMLFADEDIITYVDGKRVHSIQELDASFADRESRDIVAVRIYGFRDRYRPQPCIPSDGSAQSAGRPKLSMIRANSGCPRIGSYGGNWTCNRAAYPSSMPLLIHVTALSPSPKPA